MGQSFQKILPRHIIKFKNQSDTLVVSFDFAFAEKRCDVNRQPWGYKYLSEQGYSILGVMVKTTDWYRDAHLHDYLLSLKKNSFFDRFAKTVFLGGSMGGYAAAAFSSLVPGSTVLAINPQSTLNSTLVPWEKRFAVGQSCNWRGGFSDAALESQCAKEVYLVYDPYFEPDRLHAQRFKSENVTRLHCPFYRHHLPAHLNRLGILKPLINSACLGTLTQNYFNRLMRQRKQDPLFLKRLYEWCRQQQKWKRAQRLAEIALDRLPTHSDETDYFRARMALYEARRGRLARAHRLLSQKYIKEC